MGLFGKKHYDRSEALERAAKLQGKGKKKKAIEEYKKVLSHEPENAAIQTKLAVLLAETKQNEAAWHAFVRAAESWRKQGFGDREYAVYKQATRYMPHEVELWETLAKHDLSAKRAPDALAVLLEGRKHMRKRRFRPMAVRLLRFAVEIEPWHFEATFDLAKTLRSLGESTEARDLFEGLADRNRGRKLRRVRGVLFRMSPTPAAAWRWARAALRGR